MKAVRTTHMVVKDWGTDDIVMPEHTAEFTPKVFHHKANGTKAETPSFAIEMHNKYGGPAIIGQFSFETLQECLNVLGYTIVVP